MIDDQAYDLCSNLGCKNLVLHARSSFLMFYPKRQSTSDQTHEQPYRDRRGLSGHLDVSGLKFNLGGEVLRRCTPPPGIRDAETDADASAWPKRSLASETHSDSVQLNVSFANGLCRHDTRVPCYRKLLRCTMIAGM